MAWDMTLFEIDTNQSDIDAVTKVLKRKSFWAVGPEIAEFEKTIAKFIGTQHALTFNSGTSALHALLEAYEVKDKEVIVPSFTFTSTVNSVVLAGGIPVFAESESVTGGLDVLDVKKRITPNTVAIIALHYAGMPSKDIVELKALADEHNLILIEDAAEAMGAKIHNKMVGTFGDSAMLSFCQNKVISTGEGGAIVTNSQSLYEKLKLIRSHGRLETTNDYFTSNKDNDYIQVGYNYRMATMTAALGVSQMNRINELIEKRRSCAQYFSQELSKIKGVRVPPEPEGHFNVYQMYTITLEDEETRDGLQSFLEDHKIMSKVYFWPVHLKSFYKQQVSSKEGDLPFTEAFSKRVLTLPFHPNISKTDMYTIINLIKTYFEEKNEANI